MTTEKYRNKPLEEKFLHLSNYLGLVVILFAVAVLVGWQFNIEFLKHPLPHLTAMNPLTAVAFISVSAAFLIFKKQNTRVTSGIGYVLASFVLLMGIIRLVGILTSFDLHIDEFLFSQKVAITINDHVSNRMAPNTALCFVLIAIAVLFFRRVNYWSHLQLFCLAIALLSLLAIIGYLYQLHEFYRVYNYTPMAIHTAICFLLLAMALLFARPVEGFMKEFTSSLNGSDVARSIIPLAVILPTILGFLQLLAHQRTLFPLELGTLVLVLSIIFIFLLLVYFVARRLNTNDRERLKVEQQLFIKNQWFNQALNSMGDGVITADINGIITLVNKVACQLTGWSKEEAIGLHIDDVVKLSNVHSGHKLINPAIEALERDEIVLLPEDTILTKKDGTKIFIDDSGATIHNQEKKIIGIVLIFRDITEKKKAEDERNMFFDISVDMIGIAGADGYFKKINRSFEKTIGYSQKEFSSKPFINYIHPEDVQATLEEVEKFAAGIPTINFANRYQCKDGNYKWIEWTFTPKDETLYALGRDITEWKKAEIKTKQLYKKLENKNKDIRDSIKYAKNIQNAFLPDKSELLRVFPNSFVFYKPKDILSGDFYFFRKINGLFFIAAVDCTGHGIPGALISMIGSQKLYEAVSQSTDTSEILRLLNLSIKSAFNQSDIHKSAHHGMDIALCSVDIENRILKYAGANRPLWIIRKSTTEVEEIKSTKQAIGCLTEDNQHYDTHTLQLQEGDAFYIFSDGYADQDGGENRKKLKTKNFKQILLDIQYKTMEEQEQYLYNFMKDWKTKIEQVDDMLVIGVGV